MKDFITKIGFTIIKYNTKNEGRGTLIIAVNKKIRDLMKQKTPPGRIKMIFAGLMIAFCLIYLLFSNSILLSLDLIKITDTPDDECNHSLEIKNKSIYLHQWHPKYQGLKKIKGYKKQIEKNRKYFKNTNSIIRNKNRWGEK